MIRTGRTLVLVGLLSLVPGSSRLVIGDEPARFAWTEADRQRLDRYARATWHSFELMAAADGLPADRLDRDESGSWRPSRQTSPTDIGAYLWSVIAAERLGLIDHAAACHRLDATLATLAHLPRDHGFFFNLYDIAERRPVGVEGAKGQPRRSFLSSVDNGWLAAGLVMVGNGVPELRDRADQLLEPMNFRFFYEPFDPADPVQHPGQFHGGYYLDDRSFTACYGMLNTEPRLVSYLAISRGQVPPDHYYRMYRTLPADRGQQQGEPAGVWKTYCGVSVFEGHYHVRGVDVVPSWGGSMFEALMVPLFVPEAAWSPRSWGVNHPLYVRLQIADGLKRRRYATWGFSPCRTPEGGYANYGVEDLGTDATSYRSFETPPHQAKTADVPARPGKRPERDGVVTPHASFLALAFDPRAALDNLEYLEGTFPIFGPTGFADSVNVTSRQVSTTVLSLDQGMILAAIANARAANAMQTAFAAGPIEASIRPLIAPEEFTAREADAGR